ncbi:hypothetical protein AVEN_2959-1, partial [Araneus ventricosus]
LIQAVLSLIYFVLSASTHYEAPCNGSGRGGLVVTSRFRGFSSKPDFTEDPPCILACGAEVWRGGASGGVVLVL